MDEYAAWVTAPVTTSQATVDRAREVLGRLEEDCANRWAQDLHELMRAWENVHRMYQAEAHVRAILFREETRWPGYYFRSDKPKMDNENWRVFVNCKMDPATEKWTVEKVPIQHMFKEAGEHELLGG